MAITTLCAVMATLRVLPNRSQFFQYESVSLSCEQQGNSSDWTVKRNTTTPNQVHTVPWNSINGSHCFIYDLYPFDSGVYWCESAAGECSNTVNIFVTAGSVILDSPVLPVMEGDAVTLSCRSKTTFSNLTAGFYKNGLLISNSSTGNMTIHSVSRSHEGFYKCRIPGAGESPDSWLTVREGSRPEPPDSPITHIVLPVVGACLSLVSLVCVMLLCLWRIYKGKVDPDVPYTDVTITKEAQPNRIRDVEAAPTFYSTVKPGNT